MVIYKITNNITGKVYIGQTVQRLDRRWSAHCSKSKLGNSDMYIHRAIRKYGLKYFSITPIATCDNLHQMNHREKYYIKIFNTLSPEGYNLKSGGNNSLPCKETRYKMRCAKLGNKAPYRDSIWRSNISKSKNGVKNGMYNKEPPNKGIPFKEWMVGDGYKNFKKSREKLRKNVVRLDSDGKILEVFQSLALASISVGLKSKSNISDAIKRKGKSAGYYWKFLNK